MEWNDLGGYVNLTLTWIGFGALLGLIASGVMPGRDPGGGLATVIMGIVGALVGCALLRYFYPEQVVLPISMQGFGVGASGAVVVLLLYRVLGSYWFYEIDHSSFRHRMRRRARLTSSIVDD